MIHTQNSGVGMWRTIHPAKWLNKLGLAEVRTLPFYWRSHNELSWAQYQKDCEDKGKTPTPEEHQKLFKRRPKDAFNEPGFKTIEDLCLWADMIVVMRRDMKAHVAMMMAMKDLNKPVVFETDDFVHYVPPYNPGARFYTPGSEQTDVWSSMQFNVADYVQVTTPGMKQYYTQLHQKIYVLPNLYDPEYWIDNYPEPKPHDEIRIGGWFANAHWGNLRKLKDVITPILDKYPNVKFHLLTQVPDWWYGEQKKGRLVVHKFHNLANYAEYIKSIGLDIGLAPLLDNHFNRCKSNIRWIEYSINHAATVASPIWAYNRDPQGIAKDRENIMFAKEKEDWIRILSELIENETLRKKIADQAHKDVVKYYSLENNVKIWADAYNEMYQDFYSTNKVAPKNAFELQKV